MLFLSGNWLTPSTCCQSQYVNLCLVPKARIELAVFIVFLYVPEFQLSHFQEKYGKALFIHEKLSGIWQLIYIFGE